MRKLVEAPSGQLGLIADFSGYLEDDSDCVSQASFYEYDDDDEPEGPDAERLKHSLMSKNSKNHKGNAGRERERMLLKRIQKGRRTIDESFQQSESAETRPHAHSILSRKQKLFKTPRAPFSSKTGQRTHDGSTSSDDIQVMLKKRETGAEKVEFASSEKMRNAKLEEDNSQADVESEGITVNSFQRRKKLCKAAELGDKGHKVKGKMNSMEKIQGKTGGKSGTKGKGYSFVEGMQRKKSEVYPSTPHESRVKASPSKSFKQSLPKEQKVLNDEHGLVRAEIPGEGTSALLLRKTLSSTGHSVKSSKHRELKHEDVAGSSSSGKRRGSNKNLMHSVVDSGKKTGHAVKDLCASLETVHSVVVHQRRAIEKVCDNGVAGEEVSSGVTEGAEGLKEPVPDEKGSGNCYSERARTEVGWVMCDSCRKWRCIPASLADMIESTNCGWLCKDNPNKKFADCLVPQEKSNSEINKELEISEVSEGDEKHPAIDSQLMNGVKHQSKLSGHLQSIWTLIKHNIFQHRCRKTQTIDEQMECMCKPPEDGGAGCGEDCLNRMLSLECVSQTCPCGDLCSNQQFQRRLYTKVGWFRCGKKGFGLQVLENVSKGAFIIEYVGEVLDMAAYGARQKEYALGGQKHFYFMTLNSTEVIDACFKGNLGRFINHSCEPNCRTEKWMVNGEVCIGLFAIRDLKKGEEITFNYNFVRVCGAAAKKCLCGSRECRGFIGGDPLTPRAVVHSDSDEDDPEPIMIEESSEEESRIEDSKLLIEKKLDEKAEAIELRNKERNWMLSENTEMQVEEQLNELVDENGGLFKGHSHADEIATRYLKLLVCHLVNGEESRSTRELSMVLDALLKTQSRAILVEINSKNGNSIHICSHSNLSG